MIIKIFTKTQQLILYSQEIVLAQYGIATGKKGLGELKGSEKTPRGWHKVKIKIGAECQLNTVFVGRRPTGEIYTPLLANKYPERDWILTRILWLSGLEPGVNRYGLQDTLRRFIYIHGCPDDIPLGLPSSHGCIRMHNADIIDLFDKIPTGVRVLITDEDHAINETQWD